MDRFFLEMLRALLGASRFVNMGPMPGAPQPAGPRALAKGNKGEALPGDAALPKEDRELSITDIFGSYFDSPNYYEAMPKGDRQTAADLYDRPAFTVRDMGPPPQSPQARPSDPNPAIPLPTASPERMPLPEQNTFGLFGEFLQDMATQRNVTGPGFPAQGETPQPFAPQTSLEQALAAQILQSVPPMPMRAPQPAQPDFATFMRQQLLGGV